MEGNIQTVLDTRGALRCVRFDLGNAGVVTTKGNTKLAVGPFQQEKESHILSPIHQESW